MVLRLKLQLLFVALLSSHVLVDPAFAEAKKKSETNKREVARASLAAPIAASHKGTLPASGSVPGTNDVFIDRVVASVDGEPVTATDLRDYMQSMGQSVPTVLSGNDPLTKKALQELIGNLLLEKESTAAGTKVSDEDVSNYIDEVKKQNNVDEEGFIAILANRGMDEAKYRAQVRRDIVRSRVVSQHIRTRVNIVDEDVQRYLQEHPNQSVVKKEGEERVQQIFVRADETDAAAREKAEEEIQKIRASIEEESKFQQAGGEYYTDLGFVAVPDLREELKMALEDVDPNEVTEVVSTENGFFLLMRSGESEEEATVIPQVDDAQKEQIRQQLYQAKIQEELAKFLSEELPKKYVVETKL